MKLKKDFGVRALLATIGAIGFYAIVLIVLFKFDLSTAQIIALVSTAQAPWMLAIGFYFGTRSVSQNNTPPPTHSDDTPSGT